MHFADGREPRPEYKKIMKLSEFSVKNYQFTIVIFIMLMALGISSLLNMPRGEDPPFQAPNFFITIVYPGASPNDMESLVANKIEERVNTLPDIKKLKTTIIDGLSFTQVEFKYGVDIDAKFNDVVREINALRNDLPDDLALLEIRKAESSDVITYQYALVSETADLKSLYAEAKRLKKALEAIKDLKEVKVHGYPGGQVSVELDLAKMAQLKIPLNRVLGIIQGESANIPGGSVDVGTQKFNIKTSGDFDSAAEIANLIINSDGERIVRLSDVASVFESLQEQNYTTRYNGTRALFVTVSEKEATNIIKNRADVLPVVNQFKEDLPPSIRLSLGFDQSRDVEKRLAGFTRDFAIAIALVALTLLPLGFRAAVVVMISIPLSIAMGLAMIDMLGFTINQLSIVGLVVALGLLVDDSIVVVENIERFLRDGYSKKEAAIEATKQISLAVLGCTAALIFAFLPLIFLPEGSGDFIRSLPMAVVATVLASLFVSLTIIPFLSSMILKPHHNPEGNAALRGLKKIIGGSYSQLLNKSLAHPWRTLGVAGALFAGSIALVPVVGFSVFPKSEKPMFLINVETPIGTNLAKTDSVAFFVETEVKKEPEIAHFFTNVGKGNPRMYYNSFVKNLQSNYVQIFVRMNDVSLPELEQTVDRLRGKFNGYPDAKIEVKLFEQGPPIDAPIALRLYGEDLDSLRFYSEKVEQILRETEGTIYVDNPQANRVTDFKLNINKDKAGLLGVQTLDIDRSVRMAIAGLPVATFKDGLDEENDVLVTLPKKDGSQTRPTLDILNNVYVPSATGELIPLNSLVDIAFESTVPSIFHYSKNRYAGITAFVKPGYNTIELTNQILKKLESLKLPKGYSIEAAGELESSKESFGGMGAIVLITVFGILAILLLEFGTFKSTLIVLSVIPLGIIGAVAVLLLTGNTFSFVATVGLIALIGIEIKNSILLVDFTNYLREQGRALDEAIQEAGEVRFVPIVLTTMTAIGGLIPLVLEDAPLYTPLAWVLIGGLVSSTILTRVVTPVLYKLLAPKI